jgi:hypothetical protein
MKKAIFPLTLMIFPIVLVAMFAAACNKDNLPRLPNTSGIGLNDDRGFDDHGSDSGGGGGENISASQVPDAVMEAFNAKYTNTENVEWKKLDNGNYKVEFFQGTLKVQATYSDTGVLLKEESRQS